MADDPFIIDTSPSVQRSFSDVPQYKVERKSLELLQIEKEATTPRFGRPQQNNSHCWNCGHKNHSIRECPSEYNPITVEWNRALQTLSKEYEARKFQKKSGRYHEKDEKYAHIKPGVLSSKLRQILGLSDNELPPHIYRLRSYGYPKAWLKHASVNPSGINLYDAHGNEVADPDAEDGEIMEEDDKIKYDFSKLIKFPGFNAPMPENSVDCNEIMGCPPFSEDHSLENMVENLKEKAVKEYCLKKDKSSSSIVVSSTLDDMDVDDSVTPVEAESGFVAPLPNERDNPPSPPPDEAITSLSQTGSESVSNELSQESKSSESSEVKISLASPSQNGLGRILSSAEGTPLLKSKSGHIRLPPAENFSKDICDVINFENLPESTGKFEKMRGILKKVKHILGIQRKNS